MNKILTGPKHPYKTAASVQCCKGSPEGLNAFESLLGEADLDGGGGGDLEALERVPGGRRLHLRLELHEGDVVPAGHQPHLGGLEVGRAQKRLRQGLGYSGDSAAKLLTKFCTQKSSPKKFWPCTKKFLSFQAFQPYITLWDQN